ncbi:CST complex subunit STN1 [Mustelus asterias]
MDFGASVILQSDSERAEDIPPSILWGLDPIYRAFAKLYIKDILELKKSQPIPGMFFYKTHPITKVDILGTIVQRREREKFFSFGVDDGTGVISCLWWKKQRTMENLKLASSSCGLNLLEQLGRIDQLEKSHSQLQLGDVVQVRGSLRDYRDQREITCTSVSKLVDPVFTAQISRMLELPYLYRNFYDKTCLKLSREIQKGISRLHILESSEQAEERSYNMFHVSERRTEPIYAAVESWFHFAEGKTFTKLDMNHVYQQLLLEEDSEQQVTINTQGFVQIQCLIFGIQVLAIFQRIMDDLLQGIPHVAVYLDDILMTGKVTDEEEELHSVTLRIIRDDSTRPKYVDKGCPFHHIMSCVRHSYSEGVSEAAMQRVLDRLECNSEIVSTMDRHYTAS